MVASNRSNVFSKGQGGANFEFRVQSAFLINMLIKGVVPSFPTEQIQLIKQQSGFATDDLYVELISDNQRLTKVLVQIKHNLTFSKNDNTFQQVIEDAWQDFNSKDFNSQRDKILVIKGNLLDKEYNQLLPMLDWAETKVSAEDFFRAVNAIKAKKRYLDAFSETLQKVNNGAVLSPQTIWAFLKCFRVVRYDFNIEGGTDLPNLLNSIQHAIPDNSLVNAKQIWDKVFEFISKSDSKGGSFSVKSLPDEITDCFKSKQRVDWFVHHKHSPPLSFDYFFSDDEIIKSYTEEECKFKVTIENRFPSKLILDSIAIQTIQYKKVDSRILRLHSVKGIFTPDKFRFSPSKVIGKTQELLSEDEAYEVAPNDQETLIFELDENSGSGYYELLITAKGHCGHQVIELKSKVIPLTISGKADNRLVLETMKFFESPVETLLDLENEKWKKLKREQKKGKYLLYLGQTMGETPDDILQGSDWKIKGLRKRNIQSGSFDIEPNQTPKVFANLRIPVEEELFTMDMEQKKFIEAIKRENFNQ